MDFWQQLPAEFRAIAFLAVVAILIVLSVVIDEVLAARRARRVSAEALKRDAVEEERRRRLKWMQAESPKFDKVRW